MRTIKPTPIAVLAMTLFATATMASTAAEAVDVRTLKVSYADLNLATHEGKHALYNRVATAADKVCPAADARVLWQVAAREKCQRTAITQALREVKEATLAAAVSTQR